MPEFSIIVSTLNRDRVIVTLFESLCTQTIGDIEVIVVDQNADDRLVPIVEPTRWPFPVTHLRMPTQRGLSRGRNSGIAVAKGRYLVFADDDCWYPPWILAKAKALLDETGADGVCGRAADETGRSINGRFAEEAAWIDRRNVWVTQIEWVTFYRREALVAIGGYDAEIGVGSGSPWGANEGHDLTLRLLAAGYRAYYDPSLFGFHEELDIVSPDAAMVRKGRSYARGHGYVLRHHNYSTLTMLYWILRPAAGSLVALLKGNPTRSLFQIHVTLGRVEGCLARTLPILS